ncbi:MAG: ribose-phosphate pyrophosphokinase [bacterium]
MSIIFAFPEYKKFASQIAVLTSFPMGDFSIHSFPDGESLVTVQSEVKDQDVIVVCGLEHADEKVLPLLFLCRVVKELGAKRVGLVAPYLGYMRQDMRFLPGQAITSDIFAKLLSSFVDWLITLDPHLHRHASLDEIYTIPTTVLHAATKIKEWIKANIKNPVLIGPDQESRQWVCDIAEQADVPFLVLKKVRHGDNEVEISSPDLADYKTHTPILLDDIISTAQTMIKTVQRVQKEGMNLPVCIGIHAVFADGAYQDLKNSGVAQIITTNSIEHESNKIDVSSLFSKALKQCA